MKNYPSLETCQKIADLFDKTEKHWFKSDGFVVTPDEMKPYISYDDIAFTLDDREICKAPSICEMLERLREIPITISDYLGLRNVVTNSKEFYFR